MLVLSRQRNEAIVIGGNIFVSVVDIRGDKVRLGVEAPIEVPVHRSEVAAAIALSTGVPLEDAHSIGRHGRVRMGAAIIRDEFVKRANLLAGDFTPRALGMKEQIHDAIDMLNDLLTRTESAT
jgi:carbon storage regulator